MSHRSIFLHPSTNRRAVVATLGLILPTLLFSTLSLSPGPAAAQEQWVPFGPACATVRDFEVRRSVGEPFFWLRGGELYRSFDAKGWSHVPLPISFGNPSDGISMIADGEFLWLTRTFGPAIQSFDGGATWLEVESEPSLDFTALQKDAGDSNRFYGVNFDNLYRSLDRGATWQEVGGFQNRALSLKVHPTIPRLLLAYTRDSAFRSTDGGETFEELQLPSNQGFDTMAMTADGSTVVGLVWDGRLLELGPGASEWQDLHDFDNYRDSTDLFIDPENPERLFVAIDINFTTTQQIWRSEDGGGVWFPVGSRFPDVRRFAYDPFSKAILAITRLGISESFDGGDTWLHSAAGIHDAPITSVTLDRAAGRFMVGTDECSDGRAAISEDDGRSWSEPSRALRNFEVERVLFDPFDSRKIYAGNYGQVAFSEDGGLNWESETFIPGGSGVGQSILAADPWTPSRLLAGALGTFSESLDGGRSWTRLGHGASNLIWHSSRAGRVFMNSSSFSERPEIGRSDDGGRTWADIGSDIPDGPGIGTAGLLGLGQDGSLYAVDSSRFASVVFRSPDEGDTWAQVGDLALDPRVVAGALDLEDPLRLVGVGPDRLYEMDVDGDAAWLELTSPWPEDVEYHGLTTGLNNEPIVYTDRGLYRWTDPGQGGLCGGDSEQLCLLDGRFRLTMTWKDLSGRTDRARWVPSDSSESGLAWFFDPSNWELLVKVLDGCEVNGRYWVFLAATTNVEFHLTVTDTRTGEARTYSNSLGEDADAVTDTAAFSACGL